MKYEIINRNFGKSGVAQKKNLSTRELPAQLHLIPPQKNSYPKNVANLLPKRCWFTFPELEVSRFSSFPCSFSRYGSDPFGGWNFVKLEIWLSPPVSPPNGRVSTWHPQYCEWLDERSLVSWLAPRSLVSWLALEVIFSAEFFSHWIFCLGQNKRNVCKFILVHRKW